MKNAKIDWLLDENDFSSSQTPMEIKNFSDYQLVEYPLPRKLGKAWIETIKTRDQITLASVRHEYIPVKPDPIIKLGELSEVFNDMSLYIRLSTSKVRHDNLHGETSLSFGPGEAAFSHAERADYIAYHDTSKPFTYTGLWVTDKDLNWLIGEENMETLITKLKLDKPPVTKVWPLPNRIAQIIHHGISPSHNGAMRQLHTQAKTLEFLCDLQEFYISPLNVGKVTRDRVAIRKLHDTLINQEGKLPTIQEMASIAGMNAQKMNEIFKEEYQQTIHSFITQQRLEDAHAAIELSDIPLKEVAMKLGYSHVNHFSNAFKRQFGYAPSSIRKK